MQPITRPASALVLAALVAALLATAAAVMLAEAHTARAASGESIRLARAQLADQALLARAVAELDAGQNAPVQGLMYDGADGRVERQDAAGLVDINAAPPDLLATLFRGLGVDGERAAALGDTIADWRDADDLRRLHGAEAQDYRAAGAPAPRNGPFAVETELALVLGMDTRLLACVLPYVTVYGDGNPLDAREAPPSLLELLALAPGAANVDAPRPLGGVVILRAEAPLSAHAVLARTLWLRMTGDRQHPFLVQRAREALGPAQPADPPSTCTERPE